MNIKAVVFDIDGTLVNYESSKFKSSWDAIGHSLEGDIKKTWFEHLENYYYQKDKIIEWTEKDAMLLKGLPFSHVEKALFNNGKVPYNNGVREFLNKLDNNYVLGMVSGGVNFVSDRIMNDFPEKFDFSIINVLNRKNSCLDGTVQAIDMWKKDELLDGLLKKEYSFTLENVCYIGDSGNDIPLMKRVGLPIAFDSFGKDSEEIKLYASYVIDDFRQLPRILKEFELYDL